MLKPEIHLFYGNLSDMTILHLKTKFSLETSKLVKRGNQKLSKIKRDRHTIQPTGNRVMTHLLLLYIFKPKHY